MRRMLAVAATAVTMVSLSGSVVTAQDASPGAAGWDPSAISGPVRLSGWQSSTAEGTALTQTLLGFQSTYPNIPVSYEPLSGDYTAAMAASFAAADVPDLFYVDASYAQQWIDQGFLYPIDDYLAQSGFDTSTFFPAGLEVFTGKDGKHYGLPKDFNTIAMAYNTALVTTPPTTMDELVAAATALVGTGTLQAPMCLNPGLDRGLAFLYAQGGSLLNADGTASAITDEASAAAVQWYMDLFKDGLAKTASDMGDGWCGEALGKGDVAIAFEGGWLDPYMVSTYPDTTYAWAAMPVGSSGEPVTISYTAAYAIGADSVNKDQAFVLLSYLTGVEGMTKWTQGGVALPSRSDVPIPAGKEVLAGEAQHARPGSGFMPQYDAVQKAFQDAFVNELQNKTFDGAAVVAATDAAVGQALSGS